MVRALLGRLRRLIGDTDDAQSPESYREDADEGDDTNEAGEMDADDAEDAEDGGFLRSRLDADVLVAHGMGTSKAEQEIAEIEEQAQQLEEHREDSNRN